MPVSRGIHRARDLCEWHREVPGRVVLGLEHDLLAPLLSNVFGYHLVLVGSSDYLDVLEAARVQHCTWLDSVPASEPTRGESVTVPFCSRVRGTADSMPMASESVDVVVLPHVLEFEEDPHRVLEETERVLVSEGHVIVAGYNPMGLMGAWSLALRRRGGPPWCGRFLLASRVRDWLSGLGLDTVVGDGCFFRPPVRSPGLQHRLEAVEAAGKRMWPRLCGTWFLVARKRTVAATPVGLVRRLRRKRISGTEIAGHAASLTTPVRTAAVDKAA